MIYKLYISKLTFWGYDHVTCASYKLVWLRKLSHINHKLYHHALYAWTQCD